MLFFGAGASKPLGIPTMAEFTETIIEGLESLPRLDPKEKMLKDYIPKVREIQATVRSFGLNPDIEAILSVLQGKAKPRKALEDFGAQVILFAEQYRNIAEDELALVAMTEIEEVIYKRCMQINHRLAVQLYGQLYDTIRDNLTIPVTNQGNHYFGQEALQRIFTTNYDLALETFLKSRKIGFDDGFHEDGVRDVAFDGQWSNGPVFLFKLHGSINYYLKEDGKVVRSDAPLETVDLYGRKIEGRRMIFPTGEKYATLSPYYEYLGQLRNALGNEWVCIVMGYSFRDVAINNAFLDGVRKNPRLHILILGPSANKIRDALHPNLQKNVHALNGAFGTNTLSPQAIVGELIRWTF